MHYYKDTYLIFSSTLFNIRYAYNFNILELKY